jgi:CHAT domain-containing protein
MLLAASDTARLARLEKRYASLNIDRVLTRAREGAVARRDRLTAQFAALVPEVVRSVADVQPVALREAADRLASGEALVLLHAGSRGVDGFLLDSGRRSYAWRSPVTPGRLESLIRSVRKGGEGLADFPFADAAQLHEIVLGPVKQRLAQYRRLVLVGNGALQSLPYPILLTASPRTLPGADEDFRAARLPWLVRSHATTAVPSVRSFVVQRSGVLACRAAKPFLGVGNPQLAPAKEGLRSIDSAAVFAGSKGGLADVDMLRRMASLPETEDELRSIGRTLGAGPADILVGGNATETVLKALPLSQYRIVAFATHGAVAGEVTGTSEPGLVLTPPRRATVEDDGYLALSEISALKLDADLVILSACSTATSDGRPRAEVLSGLARGFFGAGARSLIVTHWAIPSDAAVKITTGLIAVRSRDPRKDWADALRDAMLAVMDGEGPAQWGHPAYWGAFATVGVLASPR